MRPTPAPESPSTTRRTQCGAASAATHAPAPAPPSAPDEHGSAALVSDRRAFALRPSSILLASFLHRPLQADHVPAAAPPSPPAATLRGAHPRPPQTRCAIPHAAPRSHPGSASALLYPVLHAAAVLPVCDR